MEGKFGPYKLIGEVAYPMCLWFIVPFKEQKSRFPRKKQYWNVIQYGTRMAVERKFGILKRQWKILLKRIEVIFESIPNLVTRCTCLHNLCLIHGNGLDM